MNKENAMIKNIIHTNDTNDTNDENIDLFYFDELEKNLQNELEDNINDLELLKNEQELINNSDNLGNVVMNVIWEQVINQIASTAGEDFINENNGLKLDLRKDAHIQTTENFAKGKIASHNTEINYQERYNYWQSTYKRDENGNKIEYTNRSEKKEFVINKEARKPYDKNRPKGSKLNHTDMDHTVPTGEIIRDPSANAHMSLDERVKFANSDKNLNEIDSSLNRSKSDMPMQEWLDTPNANGQKPNEIFDISEQKDKSLREKDVEARKEYKKQKDDGEKRSIETGKKSRKQEAFKIGGKALRAMVMGLLADFLREIIAKLVKWFKSAGKTLQSLLDSLKNAIHSFVGKMKEHLINAGTTVFNTVANAILGPVFNTISKVWMLLKQGCSSLLEAIKYLKKPENREKSKGQVIVEVGKIIIVGLTGAGAILLSEVIEKGLITIPVIGEIFKYEIPLLGSLANILGIFLGAVVSGIIGAIVINLIENLVQKYKKSENISEQIEKGNKILTTQNQLAKVGEAKLTFCKENVSNSIMKNHTAMKNVIKESLENIAENCEEDESISTTLSDIDDLLLELE